MESNTANTNENPRERNATPLRGISFTITDATQLEGG